MLTAIAKRTVGRAMLYLMIILLWLGLDVEQARGIVQAIGSAIMVLVEILITKYVYSDPIKRQQRRIKDTDPDIELEADGIPGPKHDKALDAAMQTVSVNKKIFDGIYTQQST